MPAPTAPSGSLSPSLPVVLARSDLGRTGHGGLQADAEAIASTGAHLAPVVTAVNARRLGELRTGSALAVAQVAEQARRVVSDLPVAAVKVGTLATTQVAAAVHILLADFEEVPVALDPACSPGATDDSSDEDPLDVTASGLLPRATGQQLRSCGCRDALITGTREPTSAVVNTPYCDRRRGESCRGPRVPGRFPGAGDTLSAVLAALLARGSDPAAAAYEARAFVWRSVSDGYALGTGGLPNRRHARRPAARLH